VREVGIGLAALEGWPGPTYSKIRYTLAKRWPGPPWPKATEINNPSRSKVVPI